MEKTTEDHFEVTLSFNGQKKNIFIPFRAITSFTDPSVGFGLQFKVENELKLLPDDVNAKKNLSPKIPTIELDQETKSGEIVSLDEFRDKK